MQNEVLTILQSVGAVLLNGHFVGTSGRHLEGYINKDALYPHTKFSSRIGELFAHQYAEMDIDVVAAPAIGGTILSQWTAYHLSILKQKEVLSVYTEKDTGTTASAAESRQIFRRGYESYVKGKNVLAIEDLTTTGVSLQKLIEAVQKAGGNVIAASVMVNRDPDTVTEKTFGVPFIPLAELRIRSFEEQECPMCKNGMPVNISVGHGKKYLEKKSTP
ncbi:MAG: phosphoribosyltransferase family protein [Patescibacteria group bacterium]